MNRTGVPLDAFAGRFHFGRCAGATEFFVDIRKFVERKYRNLDRVAFFDRLKVEVFHLLITLHKFDFRWLWLLIFFNLNLIIRKLVNE